MCVCAQAPTKSSVYILGIALFQRQQINNKSDLTWAPVLARYTASCQQMTANEWENCDDREVGGCMYRVAKNIDSVWWCYLCCCCCLHTSISKLRNQREHTSEPLKWNQKIDQPLSLQALSLRLVFFTPHFLFHCAAFVASPFLFQIKSSINTPCRRNKWMQSPLFFSCVQSNMSTAIQAALKEWVSEWVLNNCALNIVH